METTEITGQEAAGPVVETEQTAPAAEAVIPPAAETVPAQVGWFRKHPTAVISTTATLVVIAGLAIGGISYGNQVIEHIGAGFPSTSSPTAKTPTSKSSHQTAPAPAKAAPITIGQTLTAAQVKAIQHNWKADTHAYQMSDGEYVAVSAAQPLPAAVVSDAAAKASAAVAAAFASGGANSSADEEAATHSIESLQYETGRSIILITKICGSAVGHTMRTECFWAPVQSDFSRPNVAGPVRFYSPADAVAAANTFVAQQADPSSWSIIPAA